MTRTPVTSSNIKSIGYDPDNKILEIEFKKRGDIYRVKGFTQRDWTAFQKSASKGKYFWDRVYSKYSVEKG